MPQAKYNEETLAQLAGIYAILDFLENNKSYPVSFGLHYASSLVISSLIQKLAAVIVITGDPHLKASMLKLDNFRKQLHLNDIFPTANRGFEGLTDFGSKLQQKKLDVIPIFREYFHSVGKFLNINTGGLFPANLFLDRLPKGVIKCTIEDSTKPLQSSALSSLEALTGKLYPGSPSLADSGFYKYIEPLSGGRLRSGAICRKMMEDISRTIYIATHGVPKANDYTTLSQLTGLSITQLKNSATNIDVMSKLRQLKDMVGTNEFPEVLKKVCDTTYGLFVLDLIDSEGSTVGNSALSLLNGLTSLAAHVCLTPVRAIMPRPGFLNPSFPPDVTADLEKMRLDDFGARDIQTLYTNLKAIQDRAIPWKRCIDFALATLFTLLFMAFLINILSGQYNLGSIPWFAGPCVSQGGKSALENLHYYTFGNIEAYTNKACDLLKNSLLLEPAKILGQDFELITQKTIDGKKQTVWDRVQCVFRAKQGAKKTRREINTTISEVANLLEASNIQYILISVRQNRTALYINAASAYQALTNWRWSASSNVATIAQKLEMALTRLALITDLKTKMFAILHKRNIIAGCWLDDKPGSIDYEILPGQEWNTFKCVEFVLLMKKNRFSCPINRITVENLIRAVQTTLELAAQPATAGPMLTEPGTAARRKHVKAPQPTATEPVAPAPAVLAEAHRWALPGNRNVTSNDDNIAMIWNTRNYENPIFVMNDLAVENFNSPFTYDAACTQLENPRYAARSGQQGLFITENKQTITLKLLGQMDARGNVRCSNELPPIVSTLGSSLYIINTVDNNAHN